MEDPVVEVTEKVKHKENQKIYEISYWPKCLNVINMI